MGVQDQAPEKMGVQNMPGVGQPSAGGCDWQALVARLNRHRDRVDALFRNLLAAQGDAGAAPADEAIARFALFFEQLNTEGQSPALEDWLRSRGYPEPAAVARLLAAFADAPAVRQCSQQSQSLLHQALCSLLSILPEQVAVEALSEVVARLLEVLRAIAGRRVYLSLLVEYPPVQRQLARLCAASQWFAERLARYPVLLDSLLTGEAREAPVSEALQGLLAQAGDDLEQQMERMRQFKRQQLFQVALDDVFHALPVEQVADRLSELAEAVLQAVLQLAWRAMVTRHGRPTCRIDGQTGYPQMAVIAYGKLGGRELGYASDLDIIFLHDSRGERQYTDGAQTLDNRQFFARVAQRVIHFMSTRSYSGLLYEIDTRLRPDGRAGLMVSSIEAFETYQRDKAWLWEHQALIRARFITAVGGADAAPRLAGEFDRIRKAVLTREREAGGLLREVAAMREKMRRHLAGRADGFDVKQDAGGLVDIEFMTQAGVLLHAARQSAGQPACLAHTATLALIESLRDCGWYSADEADVLARAYRRFRRMQNRQALQCPVDNETADGDDIAALRAAVTAVWRRIFS